MSKSLFEYKDFRLNLSIAELFSLRWPLHRHYALEMLFVKSGYMKLVYDDGAQQKILHVSAGEFIVFFPNVAHAYLEQAMGSRFYVLNINPHAVPAFQHYFLLYQPVRPLLSVSALPADFSFIFERFSSPEILQESEGICHAYLSIFLERIVEAMPLKRIESAYFAGDEAAQLIHYIEANYRRPVTLALIAQDTGLNRCHISRFFSRQLRQSLRTYVNALRIRDVCQALQHTDKSITEIMYECGFRHQQSFNRIFRALCGTTPGAYRSRYHTDRPNTGIQTGSLCYYRQCDAAHQYLYQPGCEPVLERITTPPAPFLSACT